MPELQEEVFPQPFFEGTGGEEIQVPEMREQKESAGLRRLLRQNFQEELVLDKGELPF